ncbi:SusC/RagA family TonB-linked outer membrane protein [Empedobacter falsenii]|uniref:SusC/RagA family TonB-linked outer membrane protein n=1 Tax=Empedobacter falsenii TaxID=343874 RepID=UPI0021AA85A7|nr:SusC/RagA family TonB-linked outer membrane protein [Empedobacter falsenii]
MFSLLFVLGSFAYAQTTGHVKDSVGFPEADVEVKIKGTDKVAYTDENGDFNIDAKIGDILIIKGKEITVTSGNLGDLSSYFQQDKVVDLGTAVVIGYSTQRKEEVTTAVSVVSAKDLVDTKSPNITNLLQGKDAGLTIINNSGKPGSTGSLKIRGKSSIYGNQDALWVVDGVIYHKTPVLNPNDVETISILKDAAATSQYGSRGANGVVIVTTKRGRGKGLTINVDYASSWNKFNPGKFEVMNSQEMYDNFLSMSKVPTDQIPSKELATQNFDWVKNGTTVGVVQDASVSIASNTELTNLYSTINYYDEKGTVKGYEYERLSARINLDHKLSDRLTFKPKLNATYTTEKDREHSLYDMYLNMPWDSPYDKNGKLINPNTWDGGTWYGRDYSNYYYDLSTNYGEGNKFDIQANMDFEWKISNSLTFQSTNNVQYYSETSMYYVDPKSISGADYDGSIYQYSDRRIVRLFNQMLRYNRKFGLHSLSGYVAYEYSDYDYKNLGATKQGVLPGTTVLNNGVTPFKSEGLRNDYAFQAGLAQVNYGYDNRYYAQASYRYDGSSRFAKGNQYKGFYAISGGWNVSNEAFLKDSNTISNLKLRASYGIVGNVGPDNNLYMYYQLYSNSGQYNSLPALTQGQYGNNAISWETSKDTNIGLDIGLFNRINMTLDVYNKNTDGLLFFVKFPDTSGWSGYWDNVGVVNNKGIEFSINANLFKPSSEFQWNLAFNIAKNKNKVKELYGGTPIFVDATANGYMKRIEEGYDMDTWYMRKWAGVDVATGKPMWEKIDEKTGEITTVTNYNQASLQRIGNTTPDFNGGFSSTMSYKGFTLSADFVYSKGGLAYNVGRELFDSDGAYPYYNQMKMQSGWKRWTAADPNNATHPELVYNGNANSNKISSRYLEDASFLRMRSLRLGYNFDQKDIESIGLKGLGLYISGDNLWTATKYTGADVEAVISGDRTSNYPNPKRFTFGLNLTF